MTRPTDPKKDVLEQNVSSLLETGGEPPKIADAARTRIREALIEQHASTAPAPARKRARVPLYAAGLGLAAAAAAALVITRVARDDDASQISGVTTTLADGTTYVAHPDAKVIVLGPRRVRVEGAALLDVAPGKGTFVVETARGTIEVLGTRFVVDAQAARTTAAVVRGRVKLATEHGHVVVHAGEQAIAEAGRAPVRGPAPRLSHLASWAKEARRRDEQGKQRVLRNGSLFAREPGVRPDGQFGEEYPLPIKQLTVDVVVEDRVARVALDQTFHNPHDRVLEGVYKFAIPPDAALQRLAMYVDGTLTESAVVERMRARRVYEELVYRRVDPALLEYAGTGRLQLRVYPIPARQDKRLMLAYTQSIAKLYGDWTLNVPLPEVDQPVGALAVTARIKGCASCELSSPGTTLQIERSGDDAIVKLERASVTLGDSLVVHVREGKRRPIVASRREGKDRYLMVRAPAELDSAAREYRPRTWVILDDVSASRSSFELAAQADLVDAFLRELDEDDQVAVIAFDVAARVLLPPTRVDDVDRRLVRERMKGEGGVGATDLGAGLDAALQALAGVAPDSAMVLYLGDGVLTSGPRTLDVLRGKLVGKAQFIGVGVGDGPDTQTLDALAAATGGFSTTIDLADDIRWRAFDLVAALHTTRVTGVDARLVDSAGALVPATVYVRSAQLADGEEAEVVARLASDATAVAIELTGTRGGQPWQQRIALAEGDTTPGDAGYLPRLWAQRHIAARMLAKHEPVIVPPCPKAPCPTEGELRVTRDDEIRKEIVTLGKQFFLLSRHTSLLVLENDAMYAKYGVRKGSGDTWAPYALPAKIPVVVAPLMIVPDDVAPDAELVRTPVQIFHDAPGLHGGFSSGFDEVAMFGTLDTDGFGRFGTTGLGRGGFGRGGGGATSSGVAQAITMTPPAVAERQVQGATREQAADEESGDFDARIGGDVESKRPVPVLSKRASVTTGELRGSRLTGPTLRRDRGMRRPDRHLGHMQYGVGWLAPARFLYPSDPAFTDLAALIPALVPDAADTWRAALVTGAGSTRSFPIAAEASALLTRARAALPSGVYRWGDLELAIDAARRIGWRRTTETGLGETASYDGATWIRRYAELGLATTRTVREDDVAVALAYLPIWIAEPAHYARWFVVTSRGPREIGLSTRQRGKDELAFVLSFDARARLVAIADRDGNELLAVTWTASGPASARVVGGDVPVSFSATPVADAARWAHGTGSGGVAIELPLRLPAYWQAALSKEQVGSDGWRHAQRQLLASYAVLTEREPLVTVYDQLRAHGGVELGDLALASTGIASSTTDAQLTAAVAPLSREPLARYLLAGRAHGKANQPDRLAPQTRDGLVGALWSLRAMTAQLAVGRGKAAVDELRALGEHAYMLRLAGAAIVSQRWNVDASEIARAWEDVAVGEYRNVAHAAAAQALYQRGAYDAAAERVARLVAELDLGALPPRVDIAHHVFQYARRGPAAGHLTLAAWRDRVLAGTSFEHVMAFVTTAAHRPADLTRVLARATELAGDNVERKLVVARAAIQYGHHAYARTLVEPMLKTSPTRDLYQLAAQMALARSEHAAALRYFEQAQDAGADEPVELHAMRDEMRQIIQLAQQIAVQSAGTERAGAIDRALHWGQRWRSVDPGNTEIDTLLGDLLLAVGDGPGAFRQLSSAIERDPWSGSGYATVASALEREGHIEEALEVWQQAIVIDQTNPTHRLRKAQSLIAVGRIAEGDALLEQVAIGTWHAMWSSTVYQARNLLERGKKRAP